MGGLGIFLPAPLLFDLLAIVSSLMHIFARMKGRRCLNSPPHDTEELELPDAISDYHLWTPTGLLQESLQILL